jgi:AhpD family alkylhydroperoxidase
VSAPTTAPRIAPGTRRTAGMFAWLVAQASGLLTGTTPPNLFLTMGRQPALFRGWLKFAARLMPRGTLPRRESELVILRVAHLRRCAYEFEHHVRLAKREGIGRAEVERVQQGPEADGWTPRERALLAAVDQLHAQQDLDDATWAELRRHLDEPAAIEFLLLVGHYEMLATFIGTLRIAPDRPRR